MTVEQVFVSSLGVRADIVHDGLEYGTIKEWDSVAHMGLVSALEQEYGVMLETDDVIDMSSVGKAKEILRKYGADV
jgi:acyl carrier protein